MEEEEGEEEEEEFLRMTWPLFSLLLLLFFIHPGEKEEDRERGAVRLHPSSWVERWEEGGEEKRHGWAGFTAYTLSVYGMLET